MRFLALADGARGVDHAEANLAAALQASAFDIHVKEPT